MEAKQENQISQVQDYEFTQKFSDLYLKFIKTVISNPERRHDLLPTFAQFKSLPLLGSYPPADLQRTLKFKDRSMPITMGSPVILSAGGNKYAKNLPAFAALGFGGVSVGSATLKPHAGNSHRPRLGLLPKDLGMNNSMGLNNAGIDHIAHQVNIFLGRAHKRKLALGISVVETPGLTGDTEKIEDILATFRKAYRAADYLEINVSCPNTGQKRIDAHKEFLRELLMRIMEFRRNLAPRKAVYIKLSPDMNRQLLEDNLQIISDAEVTGVVLFNTFPWDRARFLNPQTPESEVPIVTKSGGRGGISGRLLYQNTLPAIRFIKKQLPDLSILASGGVDHGLKVLELLEAGADAVQCYTVLAYRYNAIHKINRELLYAMEQRGIASLDHIFHPGA